MMPADALADQYLTLRTLSAYSGISIRTLREYLKQQGNPLPCYRPGGKLLVKRSEFDRWMNNYRTAPPAAGVDRLVDDLMREFV